MVVVLPDAEARAAWFLRLNLPPRLGMVLRVDVRVATARPNEGRKQGSMRCARTLYLRVVAEAKGGNRGNEGNEGNGAESDGGRAETAQRRKRSGPTKNLNLFWAESRARRLICQLSRVHCMQQVGRGGENARSRVLLAAAAGVKRVFHTLMSL